LNVRGQLSIFGDVPRRDLGALAGLQFKRRVAGQADHQDRPADVLKLDHRHARQVVGAIDDEGDFLHHSPSVTPPLRRGSGCQKIFREKITHGATLCFY
jgi:hypothetical protein